MLAMQSMFLKGSMNGQNVKVHTEAPEELQKGSINLIPYYLIADLTFDKPDVFISVVALSETSEAMQNIVISKKFFGADMCYVMGQKEHPRLLDKNKIVNALDWWYDHREYSNYDHYYGGCYEMMGIGIR